jgi:hypothetical protein
MNLSNVCLSSPCHFSRCLAREIISDNELHRLTSKYHARHPTFTLEIHERTCKTILFVCIYHYRHIEIDLKCQCIYNSVLHLFERHWSTDHSQYQHVLSKLFADLKTLSIQQTLHDDIETIIEQITIYFVRSKPKEDDDGSSKQDRRSTATATSQVLEPLFVDTIPYERSWQARRRNLLERSSSWSHPLAVRSSYYNSNSMLMERKGRRWNQINRHKEHCWFLSSIDIVCQ